MGHSIPATGSWVWFFLGQVKLHLGDYARARAEFQIGLDLFGEFPLRQECAMTRSCLGRVALALEAYAEAHGLLKESMTLCHNASGESWMPFVLTFALTFSAYAARGVGEHAQARKYLHQALQRAIDFKDAVSLIQTLPVSALVLADVVERAVEIYALSSRYPHVANSRWYEDVAGKHIAAIAATLPPDVVAAAQERGKARDLWETAEELLDELRQWEDVND
jgi:tetratricopeptide (TPR) repeat protein